MFCRWIVKPRIGELSPELNPDRKTILCGHPLTGVGRLPNLASGICL